MSSVKNRWRAAFYALGLLFLAASLDVNATKALSTASPCPYQTCRSGQSCGRWYDGNPARPCCVDVCDAQDLTTDFYPSFPKVMRQGAGHPQSAYLDSYSSDGATPLIFAQYDAVVFSTFRIGEEIEGQEPQNRFAQEIKSLDPTTIVLGFRESFWKLPEGTPRDYRGEGSFFAHQTDGGIPEIYRNLFPNYTKRAAGEWAISNPSGTGFYDGLSPEDLRYFDGVFFPDGRSGFSPHDLCSQYSAIDFDENGVPDLREHGNTCEGSGEVEQINQRWRDGYDARALEERAMGIEISGKQDFKYVINDGGPPIGANVTPLTSTADFKNEVVDGFMIENAPEWNALANLLMNWDDHGKKPSLVNWVDTIGPGRWYEAWMGDNQRDFTTMRFHLTTAMLGDAYYGRCLGEGNMVCFWYDEFEADLGQPIGDPAKEPVRLDPYCVNPCPENWGCQNYCPYARFFERGAILVNPTGAPTTITDADLRRAWDLAGLDPAEYRGYFRFHGGQDPNRNDGGGFERVTLEGAHTLDRNGVREITSGDGILLVTQAHTYLVSDILVGNGNHDDTSPGSEPVQLAGTWHEEWSRGDAEGEGNPYYVQYLADWLPNVCQAAPSNQCTSDADCVDAQGEDHGPCLEINDGYAAKYTTQAGAEALYTPTLGIAGDYAVFEWHAWHGDHPESYEEVEEARVEIDHALGTTHLAVNQAKDYGQWNYLGTYSFDRGSEGHVRFTHPGGDGFMIADVVMFRFLNGGTEPSSCSPDLNNDGGVDAVDLQMLVSSLLQGNRMALCLDLNGDTAVNGHDVEALIRLLLGQ